MTHTRFISGSLSFGSSSRCHKRGCKVKCGRQNIQSIPDWNSSHGQRVALTVEKPESILMSFNRWLNLRKASGSLTHLYPSSPPPPPTLCELNACRGFGEENEGGKPEEMGRSAEWQRGKKIFPELMSSRRGQNWTVLNTVFSVLTWSHLLAQYHQAASWLTGVRALCRSPCPSATHICPFSSASIRLNWSVWQGQSRKSTFSCRSQLLFSILCHLNQSISIWRFFFYLVSGVK